MTAAVSDDNAREAVARVRRRLAPDVLRALVAQNAALPASAARDAHLRELGEGAAAVVTGQQVGLFLGPLYTLYKAASAVALARSMRASTGLPVVPVFWLQTEDHDLPEIAWCGLPGLRVRVPVDAENRVSIAHLVLPPEVDAALDEVATQLGDNAHLARLRRHYRPGASWSRAFAGVLAELFEPEGLVFVDPRDPALAGIAAPIHMRAIDDAERISASLVAHCAELEREGRATPVHVRAGAPLSFVHPDGPTGPRVRLDRTLAEIGGTRRFDRAMLRALAPAQFSTSALLRPILQDTLLPTVAYVGGPAEVAYFAQLQPVYAAFGLPMPRVVPRARFRIVDARMQALLARTGLAVNDLEADEATLLARVRRPADVDIERELLAPFLAGHARVAASVAPSDRVDKALRRTKLSVERALGKLQGAIARDAAYADSETVAAVRRLRDRLVPEGAPQERILGLPAFAARGGDRALVERVLAAIGPLTGQLQEIA